MAKTRDYMDYLDENIEIAPANSQEEYQAAQTIAEVMRDHGLETSVEEFEAASMSSLLPHILVILAIVALVACGLTEGIVHVVTLIIGLLFMGLVLYSHFVNNIFENFGPTVRSQNVVGIHRATGSKVVKGARPIVVVAHYDTPRENFLWKGALASQQALLRRSSVICYITIAVCTLFQALSFVPNVVRMVVWAIGLIAGLPLILLAVSDIAERFSSCTIGANNNKASVAALLSLVNVIRPQQDRVDGRDTSKPARRRASDPVEPRRTAPKTHTEVEEVKGIRHGRETLMALGILPPSCEIMYEEPKVRIVEDEPEVEEELAPVAELPEAPENDVDVDDVDFEDYDEEDFDEESEDELEDFDEFDEEDELAEEADEAEDLGEEAEDEESADEAVDEDLEDIDEDELEDYDEEDVDVDEEDYEEEPEEDSSEEEDLEEYEDEESDEEEYDEDFEDYDEEDYDEEDYDEDDYDDDEDWDDDFDDERESGKSGGTSWFAAKIAGIKDFFSGRKKGNGNIEIERGADRTLDEADDVYDDDEDYEDELGEDYEWDEDEYVDEEEELDEDVEEEVIEEEDLEVPEDDEEYEYVDADDIDYDDDEYEYIEYIEYVEYEEDEDEKEVPEDDAYEGYERYARIEEDENPQPAPLTAPAPVPVDIPIIGEQPSEANDEATQELEENAEPQEEAVVKPAPTFDSLPMIELEDESEEEVFEVEEDQEDVEVVYEDEPQYEEGELLEEEEVVEEQADWGYEDLYEDEDEYVDEEEPLYEETYEEEAVEEEPYEEEEVLEDVYEEDVPDDGYVYEDDEELVEEEEYVSSEYDDTYSDLYEQDSVDTYEEEEQYVVDDASDLYSSASVGTSLGQRLKGVFRRMRGADQGSFISEEEEEVVEDTYEEDDYATDAYEDTVSASNPYEDEAYDDEGYLTDTYEPQAYEPEVREEEAYEEQYYEDDSYDDNVEEEYVEEYEDEYEEYDDEGDSEWYDYEYEDEEVEYVEEEPVEEEVVENAEEPTQLADPNLLHFDREEDDDILPRDTTGLDMYTDPYDVYPRQDVAETSRQRPAAMDDPTWGTASYQPARPVMNIARRAALFDLPDPSKAAFDPLASEYDDEEYDEYDDDGRNNNWKGGAAVRSDLRDGDETDEPLVIDADDLQDAILELGDDYLLGHDIWFVATGASAYDHAGIKAFVDEHRRDFRGSFLINLESIGAGDLTILTNEGFHAPRRADRRIVRMIADIARDLHIPIQQSSYNWDETEATTAMRARVRATTIMGMDEKGQPAYAHTSDDLPENIDANKVSAVVRIVSELIRRA